MKIDRVVVGELEENCYVLTFNNACLIVDPGDEADKIISCIGNKKVLGILITHSHFDHVGALKPLLKKYKVNVYSFNNIKETNYQIGNFNFDVIFNPGHTIDSISFYFKEEQVMFVGDFVFKNTIGRCDLEGGNINEMRKSIDKLKEFNDNIVIYPGHGPKTELIFEKMYNPYF